MYTLSNFQTKTRANFCIVELYFMKIAQVKQTRMLFVDFFKILLFLHLFHLFHPK